MSNDVITSIAVRLKAARKSAGYRSATAFADQENIPMSTYSQHEGGKRSISSEALMYYSNKFGVQAGWLLSGQGTPFQANTEEAARKCQLVNKVLDQEAGVMNVQELKAPQLGPIVEPVSIVDMYLFKEILVRLLVLHSEEDVEISDKELIDFSIEVYNGVINTSASIQDKIAMIDLSIASLRRGVVKQELLIKRQKLA